MKIEAEKLVQLIIALQGKYDKCVYFAEKYLNDAYQNGARDNKCNCKGNDPGCERRDINNIPKRTS